jgi:hypothetical protein
MLLKAPRKNANFQTSGFREWLRRGKQAARLA